MACRRIPRLYMASSLRRPFPVIRSFSSTTANRSTENSSLVHGLKDKLKDAMRAKDKERLNVLRSLMAEITNASKTPNPVNSDAKLLVLLKKQIASSEKALEEFEMAKRDDLVEKERGQIQVLKGYLEEIPVLSKEQVDRLVDEAVRSLQGSGEKADFKSVMRDVMKQISGKPVDQSYVVEKIKSVTS
ncbi:GatB/YqeY domain-containing protein [Westerdykella ornata]|uniref:Altered inheritance of mitochondria protein 41 n=1 Tax=Westerdykella ornata TaxID=318751 RepID=A0A6A6J5R8_WESOR|nr:GatB/YqeY domain-containing protein [Westerdykella ornata]KAF2271473.1 GatB/YqeY domain-containing protein [Westerdykella ornata]